MKRLGYMILAFALAVGFAGCAGSHAGMNNGMGSKDAGMHSGMGSKDTGMHSGMGSKDAGMHDGMVAKDAKMKCPKCGATFTVEEGQKALDGP